VALVVRMLSIERLLLPEAKWPYGVDVVPLSSYFNDWNGSGGSYPGHLLVAPPSAVSIGTDQALSVFLSDMVDALGRFYNSRRLLRIGLREMASLAGLRFNKLRIRKETMCSEYVHHALGRLGIDIPWNHKGYIVPHDIAMHEEVKFLCRIL
jgi:hypothetical protein